MTLEKGIFSFFFFFQSNFDHLLPRLECFITDPFGNDVDTERIIDNSSAEFSYLPKEEGYLLFIEIKERARKERDFI